MGDADQGSDDTVRRFPSWTLTALRLATVGLFLYVFLVGIKALEKGIGAFGASVVDSVFTVVGTPWAGLAAGILATALVQSSSVTTSTIVGLVGAGVLPFEAAVPMVMGANIGTTVTNTLASLGHLRHGHQFRLAFAAATVHDYFNILSVALLLPLEVAFGVVSKIASWLTSLVDRGVPSVSGSSPIKTAIEAPIKAIAGALETLLEPTAVGLPLLVIGITLVLVSLWVITRQMKNVMSGSIEHAINRVLAKGAGIAALVVGLIVTMAVQSSSVTTSILVPLAATGVLTLKNAYPVTLGANIGTTVTALLASVSIASPEGLKVALAHLTFNVLGTLIFYPVPALRAIPINLATRTAATASEHKTMVVFYLIGIFIVLPLIVLIISA